MFRRQYFHGTRADLAVGDLIAPGFTPNFGEGKPLSWVYCTGTLDAAIWGAELAAGDTPGRIYLVEPIGELVDDPNLTLFGSNYQDVFAFFVLIAVLIFRPSGLLGERVSDRA